MEVVQIDTNRQERYYDSLLEVDFHTRIVTVDMKPVSLTNMEFRLLAHLAQNAGDVVGRTTLLMSVWGYSAEVRTRTLDVHIRRLRGLLGDHSRRHIETIFGVGYRLQPCTEKQFLNAVSA